MYSRHHPTGRVPLYHTKFAVSPCVSHMGPNDLQEVLTIVAILALDVSHGILPAHAECFTAYTCLAVSFGCTLSLVGDTVVNAILANRCFTRHFA